MTNEGMMGLLSGLPMEKILQLLAAQNPQLRQQPQASHPAMQMQQMQTPNMQMPQMQQQQEQEQNPMGMLSKLAPMISGGRTSGPQSVMGSGGPLTVPGGSVIGNMDPGIMAQIGGGKGGGLLGLLKGLF